MSEASVKVELQLSTRKTVAVLAIKGRLDAVRVGSVREEIGQLPEKGHTKVVLDLTDLEWIDSSGVGALVVLYKNVRAKGGEVKVANLQRQPKEIFRLLRLETAFEIFDTVDAAVTKLGG